MNSAGSDAPDTAHVLREADTATLLTSGGDERLVLDPGTGLNRYGCGPRPEAGLSAFASSTASTISPAAFAAACSLHQRLGAATCPQDACAAAADDLRARLAVACGLEADGAHRVVLSPSGTDAHRLGARLARHLSVRPLTIVLPEPCETGRGVPGALGESGPVCPIRLREDDGRPRDADAMDAEVERLCAEAIAGGSRVLLCLLDVSKTGLIAPSAACARDLALRFRGELTVLVDACQFRLAPQSVRGYLDAGFWVILTGSKFLGGPAFSGALIVPDASLGKGSLAQDANPGLLLRWEAALTEAATFRALPDGLVAGLVEAFGGAVEARLDAGPHFERLPTPALKRFAGGTWDRQPTIFSFVPVRSGQPLTSEATQTLFGRLKGVRLGQPVVIGQRNGQPLSALRVALGARQITAALTLPGTRDQLFADVLTALDRTAEQIGG